MEVINLHHVIFDDLFPMATQKQLDEGIVRIQRMIDIVSTTGFIKQLWDLDADTFQFGKLVTQRQKKAIQNRNAATHYRNTLQDVENKVQTKYEAYTNNLINGFNVKVLGVSYNGGECYHWVSRFEKDGDVKYYNAYDMTGFNHWGTGKDYQAVNTNSLCQTFALMIAKGDDKYLRSGVQHYNMNILIGFRWLLSKFISLGLNPADDWYTHFQTLQMCVNPRNVDYLNYWYIDTSDGSPDIDRFMEGTLRRFTAKDYYNASILFPIPHIDDAMPIHDYYFEWR